MSHQANQPKGPPYASPIASPGGHPTEVPDVILSSLFLALYIGFAIFHQYIYQTNRRRGHNFKISLPLFGFCMARIMTNVLRIVWVYRQSNVSVAIAANIFTNAGTLLLYIINLLFAQRIFRARQPTIGWNRPLHFVLQAFYILIFPALIVTITLIVLGSYTLNPDVLLDVRDGELAAITFITIFAALAPALLVVTMFLPKSKQAQQFGQGSLTSKALIVATSSIFCLFISGYRCGATWQTPRPIDNSPWWDSKACFYVFVFTMEAMTMIVFASTRVDLRFHVPDGSSKRMSYEEPEADEVLVSRGSSQSNSTDDAEKLDKEEV